MTKHTPAPWFWGGHPRPPFKRVLFGVDGGVKIASTGDVSTPGDAHLIAAAPDLLEACKAMLADLDARGEETCWCLPDDPGVGLRGTVCEACQMRAAIAKVEGNETGPGPGKDAP